MTNASISASDFEKLMDNVEVLQAHFDEVDRKAARLMVKMRRANDRSGFDQVVAVRRAMRNDYGAAMDLIAEHITTPQQLRKTRSEIKDFKKIAWGFVKDLRKTKLTLDKLAAAANVLGGLLRNLRLII